MEQFAETGNNWKLLTIFTKSSVLKVWLGYEYVFAASISELHILKKY